MLMLELHPEPAPEPAQEPAQEPAPEPAPELTILVVHVVYLGTDVSFV